VFKEYLLTLKLTQLVLLSLVGVATKVADILLINSLAKLDTL